MMEQIGTSLPLDDEDPTLSFRIIIFKIIKTRRYLNVADRGRTPCRSNTVLCVALRGKTNNGVTRRYAKVSK